MKCADESSFQIPYPASYYVRAFKQLDETGQSNFNWSAAIFGPFWALYRKMHLCAIPMLISVPINIIFSVDFLVILYKFTRKMAGHDISVYKIAKELNCFFYICGAFLIYQAITTFLYGKYGNRIYYNLVKKRISQGYHLAENISATTSPFVVILMVVSFLTLSFFVYYVFTKLFKILNIGYNSDWKCCYLTITMVSTLILIAHPAFDALVVKKFKKSHEMINTKISKENIVKYLMSDGINPYSKIFNTILFIVVCRFIWTIYEFVYYTC